MAGVTIIVVAVSDWVNENEVKEIATDPDEHNVIRVINFNQINTIKKKIAEILCNGTYKTSLLNNDLKPNLFAVLPS